MSERYPGGLITKTPVTPAGPYQSGTAPGVWTLDQQLQYQQQGIWPTAGLVPNYIEDVFSTYLYTGNGSTQTITNGIDLSTKGGMVWTKERSPNARNHFIGDSARNNFRNYLYPNLTNSESGLSGAGYDISSVSSTGYALGPDNYTWNNESGSSQVSWTFRKQPKFFDVVTWSGSGSSSRSISHALGSTPGCIIVKGSAGSGNTNWWVYHRSIGTSQVGILNTTAAFASTYAANTFPSAPTSTDFTVGDFNDFSGYTYVAYLFAHDAGGFGLSGTDNVISCGSFTPDGSGNATVTLGYEPQWLLMKNTGTANSWYIFDNMRGFSLSSEAYLLAESSSSEGTLFGNFTPTSTGFNCNSTWASRPTIYIAIRRGPMKTPTSGTSVFSPLTRNGTGSAATLTGISFPIDMTFITNTDRVASSVNGFWDRLRGSGVYLNSNSTVAEASNSGVNGFDVQDGLKLAGSLLTNGNSYPYVNYFFRRAPGFFDEVCYTGTGSGTAQTHNLGVVPELMITKRRDSAQKWWVFSSAGPGNNYYLELATNVAASNLGSNVWLPTTTTFTPTPSLGNDTSGGLYLCYIFATVAGVSKVGSYTGTGALQTVNCGFTSGARFVLIKRTDSTGDWYVYDSARGITSGSDPYIFLNSTAAEVTGTNYVDTDTTGFKVTAAAPAGLNANGGTYIFLAIA